MKMEIRKATNEDINSILTVIKDSILATHKNLYTQDSIDEILSNYNEEKLLKYITNNDYFVAKENQHIVGCVLAKEDKMRSLYVLPDFMGKGLGRQLAETAEFCIKGNGYKKVWLWSSLVAHNFYKHMGYKDIQNITNEKGEILHIEMEKYF